jgi:hypothetical protein
MHPRPRDRPIEDSSSAARSGEYTGSDPSPFGPWPVMAVIVLCWESVINMTAVSRNAIVSKEEISAIESDSAFHAPERPLFSMRSLISVPMFTATETSIAELTLRCGHLAGGGGGGSHVGIKRW